MSSTQGPPYFTITTLAPDGSDVDYLVRDGEASSMGKSIKDEGGKLGRKEEPKEHYQHGRVTDPQLLSLNMEGQDDQRNGYEEGAWKNQDGYLESEKKVQELSSSAALKNPTIQPSKDKPHADIVSTNSGFPAPASQLPLRMTTSLLFPQSAQGLETTPVPSSRTSTDGEFDTQDADAAEEQPDRASKSEIQSIMDQFDDGGNGPDEQEVMSPRLEFAGTLLGSPVHHPPRKSSLEPINATSPTEEQGLSEKVALSPPSDNAWSQRPENSSPASSIKSYSMRKSSLPQSGRHATNDGLVPQSPVSLHKPLPPEPDAEPDLPFDFHRFLEQLRHRTADPVAKFLRSFLIEFGKKQWMVHEQVKIISDFLAFIANKMAQCEVWRGVSDAEFDNAKEGMEKLVMNRLYSQTFSPAIPPPAPLPQAQGKRKNIEKLSSPGRRGQHQEDIERDEILEQKVRIYGWVQEQHLDIATVGDSGRRFLVLAQKGKLSW